MHSSYKSKGVFSRLPNAVRYSVKGLKAAWQYEFAFRTELAASLIIIPLAIWLGGNKIEALLMISSWMLVLVTELLNSALEAVADAVTTKHNTLLGRAKDLGSAAVMLSIIIAALVWVTIIFM